MTFGKKLNGFMRLVRDYVYLNKYIKLLIYLFKCAKDIINEIDSKAEGLAAMDCKAWYWQLELDNE